MKKCIRLKREREREKQKLKWGGDEDGDVSLCKERKKETIISFSIIEEDCVFIRR